MLGARRRDGEISEQPEVSPFRVLTDSNRFERSRTGSNGFVGNRLATAARADARRAVGERLSAGWTLREEGCMNSCSPDDVAKPFLEPSSNSSVGVDEFRPQRDAPEA